MNRDPDPDRILRPKDSQEQKTIDAAVADVLEAEGEKARLREEAPVPREGGNGPFAWIALLFLSALSAYLWIAPPPFLQASFPEPFPALVDAGVRMEVGLQALNVEDYLEREGRLPTSLEEAGDPFSLVTYERIDFDHYQLSLSGPTGRVTYRSSQPLDAFLGNAMDVIREGGQG